MRSPVGRATQNLNNRLTELELDFGDGPMSRAGGDRTHDRGIMRWEQSVGLVQWCRFRPGNAEFIVRWRRIGPVVSVWYVG